MQTHMAKQNQAIAIPTTESRSKTLLGRAKTIGRLAADLRALSCDASSFVSLDADDLARQVRDRVRDRADAKDVDVVLHCTCSRVWVQPHSFSEALYELFDNAVQATRKRHPVVVDVRDTVEGDVLWQIQDAGEGMSERVLAELAQPPHTVLQGGSILGVALAWAVVEKHGGSLRFESAPGVGTTASIWLPRR